MNDRPWLVIIDPQVIFADASSAWAAPRFGEIVEPITQLAEAFGDRTLVTRWVPTDQRPGSWTDYFTQWTFADRPATDAIFDLVPAARTWSTHPTIDLPTFGKWGEALAACTGEAPHVVLTGVATDCCVISTALAAADAGAHLTVLSDACAGSSDENHAAALHVMNLYAPQIRLATTEEALTELRQ